MEPKILIVEDVEAERACLVEAVRPLTPIIDEASSLQDAEKQLRRRWPDLVVLDTVFPPNPGAEPDFMAERFLDTLKGIGERVKEPDPVVILVIGNPASYVADKVELIRQWRENGSVHAIELKIAANAGWKLFQTLLERAAKELLSARHFAPAKEELEKNFEMLDKQHHIVTGDLGLNKLYQTLIQVASTDAKVLISGESGTGKELVARAIHELSPRKGRPFEIIDLAGRQTGDLLESALFGWVRGGFTGAFREEPGPFERANGGTVFLDEIAEVPLAYQGELLRVLANQEVRRLGGKSYIKVDVRFVAATNRNLRQMVRLGEFRQDLFSRLNVVPIELPPLRERRGDIPLIANHFLSEFNAKCNKIVTAGPGVMGILSSHSWSGGNVRDLRNFVERMVVVNNEVVQADWVRNELRKDLDTESDRPSEMQEMPSSARDPQFIERPTTVNLKDSVLLEDLKDANSPKWLWLTKKEDEEGITRSLRDRFLSDHGCARLKRLEQWLNSRKSRQEGGEGDNPRRIHHYKLLLYLVLRSDHAGFRNDFKTILPIKVTQISTVLEGLIEHQCVAKSEEGGTADRFVLAQGMLQDPTQATLCG